MFTIAELIATALEVEATMILVTYITLSMLTSGFLWPLEATSRREVVPQT